MATRLSKLGDFTAQAAAYARARPTYPGALVERLLRHVGAQPGSPVVDLGAGTGLFTQLLCGRGLKITAIEPNAAMRAQAPKPPEVCRRMGSFEATGLPARSQQWAVTAQAFHWATPAQALPEIHHILRPGGFFTVLWNSRCHPPGGITAWTARALRRHVRGWDESYRHRQAWGKLLRSTGHFDTLHRHWARHVVRMPRQRYLDLWRSHNRLNTLGDPRDIAAFMADLRGYLGRQGADHVDVEYICRAWTVRRA